MIHHDPTTCCGDPAQCFDPCGLLGKSEQHARPATFTARELRDPSEFTPRIPQPKCPGCDCDDGDTCWDDLEPERWLGDARPQFLIALYAAICALVVDLLVRVVS